MFGQSAGGDSVVALLLSDQADGLFHRAIVQSAPMGVGTGTSVGAPALRLSNETGYGRTVLISMTLYADQSDRL